MKRTDAKYAAICGITEEELSTDMSPDIAMLSETYETTPGEMHAMLKQQYPPNLSQRP